jgi:phosphatidate cytidylyltransferase
MASKTPSNLLVRLLTAAVASPIILGVLYFGPPWGFYCLVLPGLLVGAFELFAMTHEGDRLSQVAGAVVTGLVSLVAFLFSGDAKALFSVLLLIPLVGPLLTLWRLGDMRTAALRLAMMSFGPIYVGLPLTTLALLRRQLGQEGAHYVVLALMIAWFGDTGGYFAGRAFGKRKLYEAVSPKKTVEGAVGGLVGSIAGSLLAHFWYLPSLSLTNGIALACIAGALGQLGDLGESLIKRSTGVKDSGQILPGHGGILDRVDALIFSSAAVYMFVLWNRLPN